MNIIIFLAGIFTGIIGLIVWALLSMAGRNSRAVDKTERWAEIQKEMGHENLPE